MNMINVVRGHMLARVVAVVSVISLSFGAFFSTLSFVEAATTGITIDTSNTEVVAPTEKANFKVSVTTDGPTTAGTIFTVSDNGGGDFFDGTVGGACNNDTVDSDNEFAINQNKGVCYSNDTAGVYTITVALFATSGGEQIGEEQTIEITVEEAIEVEELNPQVTLCHATAAASNPYVKQTVDAKSIINLPNGHNEHNDDGLDDLGDIIPSFDYNIDDTPEIETYPGKNWDTLFSNGLTGEEIATALCEVLVEDESATGTEDGTGSTTDDGTGSTTDDGTGTTTDDGTSTSTDDGTDSGPLACPAESDTDGDGWGWNGVEGCEVDGYYCPWWSDHDGDGWGWDGEKGCKVHTPANACEIEGHKYDQDGNPLSDWTIGLMKVAHGNGGTNIYDLTSDITDTDGYFCLEWDDVEFKLRGNDAINGDHESFVYRVFEIMKEGWEYLSVERGVDVGSLEVVDDAEIYVNGDEVSVDVSEENGFIYHNAEYHVDFYNFSFVSSGTSSDDGTGSTTDDGTGSTTDDGTNPSGGGGQVTSGDGSSSSGSRSSGTRVGTRTSGPTPQVAGISDSPTPLVLGDQVSAVPVGAPNAGAGGATSSADTAAVISFLLMLSALLSFARSREMNA